MNNGSGTICAQFVRCGRPNCRCTQGQLHGPYYYRFWREDGRLKKEYVKCNEENHQKINDTLRMRQQKKEAREQWNALWSRETETAEQLLEEMMQLAREAEKGIWSVQLEARSNKVLEQAKEVTHRMRELLPEKPS